MFSKTLFSSAFSLTGTRDLFLSQFKSYKLCLLTAPQLRRSHFDYKSTIFAVSSGHGKSGVAVIRISGPETFTIVKSMACYPNLNFPKPRYASLRSIVDPMTKDVLDEGLCLWFPKPHSFTGEDCAEFQVHGSQAVLSSILSCLSNQPHLRPAEPGEFSRRAFYHQKLDLTQIEALGDLIDSETEVQRKRALGQMRGDLTILYAEWRKEILECLASVEAYIDFSEDEIIEDNVLDQIQTRMRILQGVINRHFEYSNKCGVRIRSGIKTVIVGEPNVGKSSLMNLLCQKQTSIVTPIPGTTRDVIEKHLDISGYPVVLLDTAGLRHGTTDVVETEGIHRARSELYDSDLTIIVVAYTPALLEDFQSHIGSYINDVLDLRLNIDDVLMKKTDSDVTTHQLEDKRYLVIINKMDLATPEIQERLLDSIKVYDHVVAMSCTQGTHMPVLLESLIAHLTMLCGILNSSPVSFTTARHAHHLTSTLQHISSFLQLLASGRGFDLTLAAQQLRLSVRSLGCITGQVEVEEVLDVIFSTFCIGK